MSFIMTYDNKNDRLHSILHSKSMRQDDENNDSKYKNDRSRSLENIYNFTFLKIFQFSSSSLYFFSFKCRIRTFTVSSWNDFIFKINNNIPTELM